MYSLPLPHLGKCKIIISQLLISQFNYLYHNFIVEKTGAKRAEMSVPNFMQPVREEVRSSTQVFLVWNDFHSLLLCTSSHPSFPKSAHGLLLVLILSFRIMKVIKLLATALRITKNPGHSQGSCAPVRNKSPGLVQKLKLDRKQKRVSKLGSCT